jgi:tetratricopeptide (TPR) repeat protein
VARTLNNLGVFHHCGKEHAAAEAAYRKALALREQLVRDDPVNLDFLRDLAWSRNNLALTFAVTQRPVAAEAGFREAIALLEQHVAAAARLPDDWATLAWSHGNLGVLYSRTKRLQEAVGEYDQAIDVLKRLAHDHPGRVQYASSLGLQQVNRARLLAQRDGPEAAVQAYTEAIGTLGPLVKSGGGEQAREQLRQAHTGRAGALVKLRRRQEALTDLDRALALDDGSRAHLLRLDRAILLARTGDHRRAVAEADELASWAAKVGPLVLDGAGYIHALAAKAVGEERGLPEEERGKVVARHVRRAVDLLLQAHAAGYFRERAHAERLRGDPGLDILRSDERFAKLLAAVAAGGP